jgi:magnesium transporter
MTAREGDRVSAFAHNPRPAVGKAVDRSRTEEDESGFVVPCLTSLDEERIRSQLAGDEFFWLDLIDPSTEEVERMGELFGFHPLAIEDAAYGGQRPKLDDYGEYVYMVFYGARELAARDADFLREVHLFISGGYLVTLHTDELPAIHDEQHRLVGRVLHSEQFLLYRVIDALADSFFPVLADMDERIDALEDAIIVSPRDEELQQIFALKRGLVAMRKVVTPQRDLFARAIDRVAELPGLSLDERDYFRDVYDHLIRISDLIDSYRDVLGGATDLYLSTVSNRQNDVMKQLAIVGTIFLPLAWITGFFGQNFRWLVNDAIGSTWSFVALGIGTELVALAIMTVYFRRKKWL